MTNDEKTRLAVQRELEEITKIAQGFAQIAADAERQTQELKAAFARMDKVRDEMRLNMAIENLEYLASLRLQGRS